MSIVFKARVLLELGAELISSDAVALYELIKNGIDAGSQRISIEIAVAMLSSSYRQLQFEYGQNPPKDLTVESFLEDVEDRIEKSATENQKAKFLGIIGTPRSLDEGLARLAEAFFSENSITVIDHGRGMTSEQLVSCYLTVGTPMRLIERRDSRPGERVPLGEKGIGRLAAMRLGHYVGVETMVRGETSRQELVLDWRPVFADPNLDADALTFEPKTALDAKPANESGTRIRIQDIQSDWDQEKIRALSETDFAKLADPFSDNFANQFISVLFQGDKQTFINGFQSSLLRYADAICEIDFRTGRRGEGDGSPRLHVTTTYSTYNKSETVTHEGAHLNSIVSFAPRGKSRPRGSDRLAGSDEVINALRTLGDFRAKFYWFNRGRLMRKNSELWQSTLKRFVQTWSGGLLVYRDGFRVYPYGSASDDWLDLDRKALAGSAYKLNRAQIVGYLYVGTQSNPQLQDQTNREGFRDCPEKEALRRLLRQAIISDCRTFLERIDKEDKAADQEAISSIEQRIAENQRSATDSLRLLQSRVPNERDTITAILSQLAEVEDAWERAKEALLAHDAEIEQYVHLAGVGLMVELVAHELARTTDTALEILSRKAIASNPKLLENLEAQLKTVNKRVRVLDELSIPGRQRKAVYDVAGLCQLIKELYESKAERHKIIVNVTKVGKGTLSRRVEKGQILQILDNLMSNAMYWLVRRVDRSIKPEITIEIDVEQGVVRFVDNGPGIPASTGDRVFDAFYTTKPSGEGRGLGLYISKRLATENNAELSLVPATTGTHVGFQLAFASA
jgi:signal transduction histidine kinase